VSIIPKALSKGTPVLQEMSYRQTSLFRRRLHMYWSSPATRISTVVVLFAVLLALVPVSVLPYDPTRVDLGQAKQPGFWAGLWAHPLGTDFLGRDLFSRLIFATRLTLAISGGAAALAMAFGIAVGVLAGYYGRWMDEIIGWLTDVQLAFPVMALALAIVAMFGGSLTSLVTVLAIMSWAGTARIVRAQTLSVRQQDYVEAARAVGVPGGRIIFRHVLPNVLSPVLAVASFELARLMLTESALSFLGLGVSPPQVTWGGMIGEGQNYIYDAWWMVAVPGFMLTALVMAFNFVGDGLRDALDPTTVGRKEA
jgi:peptide/nickel transport system permease protein